VSQCAQAGARSYALVTQPDLEAVAPSGVLLPAVTQQADGTFATVPDTPLGAPAMSLGAVTTALSCVLEESLVLLLSHTRHYVPVSAAQSAPAHAHHHTHSSSKLKRAGALGEAEREDPQQRYQACAGVTRALSLSLPLCFLSLCSLACANVRGVRAASLLAGGPAAAGAARVRRGAFAARDAPTVLCPAPPSPPVRAHAHAHARRSYTGDDELQASGSPRSPVRGREKAGRQRPFLVRMCLELRKCVAGLEGSLRQTQMQTVSDLFRTHERQSSVGHSALHQRQASTLSSWLPERASNMPWHERQGSMGGWALDRERSMSVVAGPPAATGASPWAVHGERPVRDWSQDRLDRSHSMAAGSTAM
jgi:hypothetical protein